MAATARAPPTLASSSPFLSSSPSPATPRLSSLRPAPPRSDFLGCRRASLRQPRGRRRRATCPPRLRRFLVRAAFDGRSVVLALAAAAANFAVLRLVLLNYARLRKKSEELAGYSDLDVQNTATNSQHVSNNISQHQNESVSKDPRHFHALLPENAQTIEKHEAITLGDPRELNEIGNSNADVMFEEGVANMEEAKRDRHEYILAQDPEIFVDAAVSTRTTAEFPENALTRENVNEESAQNAGLNQTLIDHQPSIDSQSNFQRKNQLVPPSVKGITRSESEKKYSSFSSTFNKVGVSGRIKRSAKGRSFVKEKAVYQKIDGSTNLLPSEAHVKHESKPSEYLKAYIRFLREGRLTDCLEVLENGEKNGLLDMDKVYHVRFLNACKSQKAVNEAFQFVKLIKNPTLSTFNMLLSVCACSQNFEGAFQVLLLIKEADLKADCRLYTTLISTCAKSGKVDAMFEIFHEMVNAGVVPIVHTYGALIDGCARAGQVAKAFGAYGIMRSKNVIPDRVIFNALITACGQSGAVDRAFDVLAEMGVEPTPIEPDHVTVGALMKTCARAGQVDRAREVYKLMKQYNIKGTPEVYTIAVNSCSESGDLEFALMVYNDMKQNGVVPDEMFLSALIDAAGHAGKVKIAFDILQTARSQGAKLGIISYSSLMGACCNSKNWQKALELFEDMKAIKLLPTVSTVNALITVLCEANLLKRSVEVLAEVKEAGVILNTITYSVLLVACEKTDEVEIGLKLFSEAKLDGITPNLIMCKCLTGLCLRRYEKAFSWGEPIFVFGLGRLQLDNRWTSSALFVYREMIRAGIMPSMEVFSQVLGCLKLPHDVSLRNRLVENLGVSSEAFRRFNIFSLLDGFGEYDPRSFSLFEEAASLGVVRSVSFKESPIVIDTRKLEVRTSEVYLITVLKGLKHRLAAGAKLPNITILLHVEKTVIISPRGEKTVALAGRVGQAVCAMLRRLGLPYKGGESYGKVRINGLTLRRWFQPKLSSDRNEANEPSLLGSNLAKAITNQQRNIRTNNLSID